MSCATRSATTPLLHRALRADTAEVLVLGHTRWASIGIISQPNAHPMNSDEITSGTCPRVATRRPGDCAQPYVTAVLNGDVDNFADLKVADGLRIAPEITSDAKVIPTLVSHRLSAGDEPLEAFRRTVARFDGSVAIGRDRRGHARPPARSRCGAVARRCTSASATTSTCVASEPYGVIEEAEHYLRLDGDAPADPANPTGSRGQVLELDGSRAGTLEGIRRLSYDGTELPVQADELVTARDHDPRHRPGKCSALPAQGDR